MRRLVVLAAAVAMAAVLAAPASALAADTYVNGSTGNDANDCTDPTTPCQTIAAALTQSGLGDTTFVADGTYAESVTLDQGKSLRSLDSTDPRPVIDNGSDPSPAITIASGGAGTVSGLEIRSGGVPLQVNGPVAIDRDEISGGSVGVQVIDSNPPVTLSNDLIHGNTIGIEATDSSGDTPPSTQGDVSATNVTLDNATDVQLDHTTLTLDSSIVTTPIDLVGGNGACDITYSRGPSDPSTNGCGDFDTNADPGFALAGGSAYYQLKSTSPMIDAGNPADPGPGALDFFGGPRQVEGKPCSTARRDIGADEYDPPVTPGCADTTYADASAGNDGNDCLTPATACQTVTAALLKSGPDADVFVADGTYHEQLTLAGGRSLQALDNSDPRPVIDGGTGTPLTIDSSGAGTVSGLRILSSYRSIDIQGRVTVDDDVFDENPTSDRPVILVENGAHGVVISDNSFVDPDASGYSIGVSLQSAAAPAPVVSDNTFDGLGVGVLAFTDAQVTDNQFSGTHPVSPGLPGAGVVVSGSNSSIDGNTFGAAAEHPSDGIFVFVPPGPIPPTGATISHNRISGNDVGVDVVDSTLPVSLSNDLIYDNTTGVASTDASADTPPSSQGDVSATNETIYDNAVDASASYTTLTLDSSIVGTPIDVVGGNGACSISYSRGSSSPSSNGCGNFVTSADPQFVDAASGNFRLQSSSPLIDAGNPAAPASATDFYGGPRELQGKQCSSVRRDIGAAEYEPGSTPGCPPSPPSPPAPTTSPTPGPPAPKISKQPDRRSDDTTPTFKFSSGVAGSTFRCKLDEGPYRACTSPKTYRRVDVGRHVFRVYTVDPSGKSGRPRVIRFTVTG